MSAKIKLRQLRPNPFRNVARYPISRGKVEALKASIRTTGFWDNLVVRLGPHEIKTVAGKPVGNPCMCYELAYGHHRLQALLELVTESVIDDEFELELPVRNLDDAAMVRIMAAENMKEFSCTCDVIDETVESTRAFIVRETRTPADEITAADIAQFLGGGWSEKTVWDALARLRLFDEGVLDRERLKGLSAAAGRGVQREVAKVMKAHVRAELDEYEDPTELERQSIRTRAKLLGSTVGDALVSHLGNGGSTAGLKEVSYNTQVEAIPAEVPEDERRLSTIDAAARAVNARDFQRKIEMLMKYRAHMSEGAKHELVGTLKEVSGWCREMVDVLET